MLPEGWREIRLGDVGEIVTGKTPSTKDGDLWNGHIPFVTPTDLGDRVYINTTGRSISEDGLKGMKIIPANSVLVTCIASIGKMAINIADCVTNQQINSVVPKAGFSAQFVFYTIKNNIHQLERMAGTTAVPIINKSKFSSIEIPFPDFSEQKRIAEVLGSVDAAIEATKAVIDQTKTVKQGLLQTLLTRGIGHTKFRDFSLGEIPESWEIVKLSEVVKRTQLGGNYANSTENAETGYPLIKMGNLGRGRINLNKIEFTETKEEVKSSDFLKDGDVLFNTRNTLDLVGKVAIWRSELKRAAFNSNILRLKFRDELATNEYMNYFFNSSRGIFELRKRAVGTTSVAAIYWRDCEGIELALPPIPEQVRIVATLESLENEIQIESEKLDAFQLAKSGLMKDLLTGKVRVHA